MPEYNLAFVGHFGHGKTTLLDTLLAHEGSIGWKQIGDQKYTDSREDEISKGSSVRLNCISNIRYLNDHHFHIIDTPGHGDFNAEVVSALSIADITIIVVDGIEGPSIHTETVIRQCISWKCYPILILNKIDKGYLELQMTTEDIYIALSNTIDQINQIVSVYDSNISFSPQNNNVLFASGILGFGFSLNFFAKTYSEKFGVSEDKMNYRLWGDNFFNPSKKSWIHSNGPSLNLKRAFCQFILDPIQQICTESNHDSEKLNKMLTALNLSNILSSDDRRSLNSKQILKKILFNWMNLETCLFDLIVNFGPGDYSKIAQIRAPFISSGDWLTNSIKLADPNGPLIFYSPKQMFMNGRFVSYGKILSGSLHISDKVAVIDSDGDNQHFHVADHIKSITKILSINPRSTNGIDSASVGEIVGIVGIDHLFNKSAIIVSVDDVVNVKANSLGKLEGNAMRKLSFIMDPILRQTVAPVDSRELPKLVEGLKKLSKIDSILKCTMEASGEHIIHTCGEQHADFAIRELKALTNNTLEFKIDRPIVPLMETVSTESTITCLSKSPNKHNRLFVKAVPMEDGLSEAIERGEINPMEDTKSRIRSLIDDYGWDGNEARKIWCFGPENIGPNCVCDVTQGIQYLAEIKDHVNSGFQWASKEGPLCEEPMRGIRFKIHDVMLHADSIHRGAGQLMPTTRRVLYASELTGNPRLMEPLYRVEIDVASDQSANLYSLLSNKRGVVLDESPHPSISSRNIVLCQLPILTSFDFGAALRSVTGGNAFPTFSFDSWRILNGDPLTIGTVEYDWVMEVRKRKGIKMELPVLSDFNDKL